MTQAKPFPITKRQVWEAYKRVKAHQAGVGVDEQSLAEFAEDLENNLYKLWNRLASGSWMPPPVKRVEIPKAIRQEVRGWRLQLRSDKDLDDLARMFNAVIRGWVNYYGAFYKSALYPALLHIDRNARSFAVGHPDEEQGCAEIQDEIPREELGGIRGGAEKARRRHVVV